MVANSVSSLQVHWRRGNVDLRMGMVLLLGGMFGSSAGVWLFTYLKRIGQIEPGKTIGEMALVDGEPR